MSHITYFTGKKWREPVPCDSVYAVEGYIKSACETNNGENWTFPKDGIVEGKDYTIDEMWSNIELTREELGEFIRSGDDVCRYFWSDGASTWRLDVLYDEWIPEDEEETIKLHCMHHIGIKFLRNVNTGHVACEGEWMNDFYSSTPEEWGTDSFNKDGTLVPVQYGAAGEWVEAYDYAN